MTQEFELNFGESQTRQSKGVLSFEEKIQIAQLKNSNPELKNKELVSQVLKDRTDLPKSYLKNAGSVVHAVKAYLEKVCKNEAPTDEFKALQEAELVIENPKYTK